MKLSQEFDCRCQIKAVLTEGGELNVTFSANAVYHPETGAYTTAVYEIPEKLQAKIKVALQEAMNHGLAEIPLHVMDAVSVSRDVAKRLGEIK